VAMGCCLARACSQGSLAPSQMPRISRNPSALTAEAHQQRHVANLTSPAALHHDAVEVEIRMLVRGGDQGETPHCLVLIVIGC